jgi:hypothetical protein
VYCFLWVRLVFCLYVVNKPGTLVSYQDTGAVMNEEISYGWNCMQRKTGDIWNILVVRNMENAASNSSTSLKYQALKCYCAYFVNEYMAVHFNFPGMFKDSPLFNIPQHSVIAHSFFMLTTRISPAIHKPILRSRAKTILPILRCLVVHINWPLDVQKDPILQNLRFV